MNHLVEQVQVEFGNRNFAREMQVILFQVSQIKLNGHNASLRF